MMKWTVIAMMSLAGLAGCIGGEEFDFKPGENWEETGNTVHLLATVQDLVNKEIYPGLGANMWAFCFKPADPNDQYSADAIEYFPDQNLPSVDQAWEGTCSSPGPTLRVQQGDRVIVEFTNNHFHPHTIHWHGQYVPWESDGVPGSTQDSVTQLGGTFTYDFVAARAGTLWYHCHVDTQFHVMQGLYGVIIVEPQDTRWEPEHTIDKVWVLSTMARDLVEATPARIENPHVEHTGKPGECGSTGEPGCQNPAVDITPDVFMINGISAPNTFKRDDTLIKMGPDDTVRLRILNAGTEVETIHLHGHDFEVTHIDGNPIPPSARYFVDTLPIAPAQRYDVLIEGRENNEGVWVVHTHVADHVTNDGAYPGGMLSKILYPNFWDNPKPFDGIEAPAGKPYVPFIVPDDQHNVWRDSQQLLGGLQTQYAYSNSWTFDIQIPCTVDEIRVSAEITPELDDLEALFTNDLTLTIKDLVSTFDAKLNTYIADETIALGAERFVTWSVDPNNIRDDAGKIMHFPKTTLTVGLDGTMNPGDIRVVANVIHHGPAEAEAICNADQH